MSQHLDDLSLLRQYLRQESTLLANPHLRVQPGGDTVQLLSRTGKLLAVAKFKQLPAVVSIRPGSDYEPLLKKLLLAHSYLPTGQCEDHQFYCYQYHPIPDGYVMQATPAMHLWKSWWGKRRQFLGQNTSQTDLLFFTRQKWYPIRDMVCDKNRLYVKTWAGETVHTAEDLVVWLELEEQECEDDKTQFFFPQPGDTTSVSPQSAVKQLSPRQSAQGAAPLQHNPVPQTAQNSPKPTFLAVAPAPTDSSTDSSTGSSTDLQQVARYHKGKLYVRTALGYVVVVGADLRCGLNPESSAGLHPAAQLSTRETSPALSVPRN